MKAFSCFAWFDIFVEDYKLLIVLKNENSAIQTIFTHNFVIPNTQPFSHHGWCEAEDI